MSQAPICDMALIVGRVEFWEQLTMPEGMLTDTSDQHYEYYQNI